MIKKVLNNDQNVYDLPINNLERHKDKNPPSPFPAPRSRLSMHEGVDTWCDCCTCEAEPRWQQVEIELNNKKSG